MSVETSVYTQQPALSGTQLRELASRQGLELRFLGLDGMPLGPDERLDESLYGRGFVIIGWAAEDAETTEAVERSLQKADKPALDRLGMAEKLGWCSFSCGTFNFADYQRDSEVDEDEEPVPAEVLERMRQVRTEFRFRCGTLPRQCGTLLEQVSAMIREATDGFSDE